ncbi:MAG: 3-isopropylmalate dehydratase small subunit [Gaiellaceae bacterium]
MKPFRRVSGPVAVLDRADVDTDQIIPKQFLKRIERTGFGQFLFFDWRFDEAGLLTHDFELNHPDAAGAKTLIAGANFGCGSSREHAAWALQDYGFEVVIAPSFGDIFATNCFKVGLVTIVLPPETLRSLIDSVGGEAFVEVDLERQLIVDPAGREIPFDFDPFQRECLLNGLDDIARTLTHEDQLEAYEASHPARVRTTALV